MEEITCGTRNGFPMDPFYQDQQVALYVGDCIETLRGLPECSVDCAVTSPPYWCLRDYGVGGQLGLEKTPEEYVANMVAVFREVRRVLKEDGTLWLNLGDSYAANRRGGGSDFGGLRGMRGPNDKPARQYAATAPDVDIPPGLKPKDLVGIPWRVAFALQADGWYLRQDIIWHKPNPMPESVRDRCTKAHEYIFLLAKAPRYYFDSEAIRVGNKEYVRKASPKKIVDSGTLPKGPGIHAGFSRDIKTKGANRRSVWSVCPKHYKGAHFAVYPPELIRPCVKAGCRPGGTVLDPFGGSGTTAQVAIEEGRKAVLVELNPAYATLAVERIGKVSVN